MGISLALSVLALSNQLTGGLIIKNGLVYPQYTVWYWLFLLYFYITFYYMLLEFIRKYRYARRRTEQNTLKQILNFLLPAGIIAFSLNNLLPFWGQLHPLFFLSYPLISLLILVVTFRFNMLDYNIEIANSISFFVLTAFFLVLLSVFPMETPLPAALLVIPLILLMHPIILFIQRQFRHIIRRQPAEEDYSLEGELVSLTTQLGQYFNEQDLSRFLALFSARVLRCTKSAVLVSRFDVRPYQVVYNDGFGSDFFEKIMEKPSASIANILETCREVINKFSLPGQDPLIPELEKAKVYLAIPLCSGDNMVGFLFLGGERSMAYFSEKDIRFTSLFAILAANALQNVYAITKAIQREKMADLGLMASQMAHDFQSFITLVKLSASENLSLMHNANYMEKLVKDLMNYTRPQDMRLKPININQLLDMSLDLVHIPNTILVEKHYGDSLPEIRVDSNQLRRVFVNLFENSIQAMNTGGGRLKISTRPLRQLSPVKRNPWIYIEILDEGTGIPEEFLEKIFDPFFTTRKHEGGNGMGLAIVKQIITRHRGFIDVTSKLNKGTIFNIRLPYLLQE
ncbi:MAG: ATP-binding protein [Calditrichia bacterium]